LSAGFRTLTRRTCSISLRHLQPPSCARRVSARSGSYKAPKRTLWPPRPTAQQALAVSPSSC